MAHALALAAYQPRFSTMELLRLVLVYGCALAVIGAGPFMPGVAW